MLGQLRGRAMALVQEMRDFRRNVWLLFAASVLYGMSQGIIAVVFNLYILSLGIGADVLGRILSAGPMAQALGSIPTGFLAERIGFRKSFLFVYGVAGLASLLQSYAGSVPLIAAAAFIGGLALSGDFVLRLPFLAVNSDASQRTRVYSVSSMLFSLSVSLGSLVAGYLPALLLRVVPDLTMAYRYTLYIGGALRLSTLLPCMRVTEAPPKRTRSISLQPYLWGMDRFTLQQAIVSLFVGLSFGSIISFANVMFVYKLGASREFFGTVAALSIIPVTIGTAVAPSVARRLGSVPAVTWLRSAIPVSLITLAMTSNPIVGAIAYWGQRVLAMMSQPLSFAFAMAAASEKSKAPVAAWLNVTFWLGNAIAAPVTGSFIARDNFSVPLLLSSAAALLAALANQVFFGPLAPRLKEEVEHGS
jgi:MFS family permease